MAYDPNDPLEEIKAEARAEGAADVASRCLEAIAQAQSDLYAVVDTIGDAAARIEIMRIHGNLGSVVYEMGEVLA
jgi:hypothetical protein